MILGIASGKGGVGKTTTVSNLGAALTELGKSVIVVDGNLTTPNLSMHLGIPLYPTTLHQVLQGKAKIGDALYTHPTGIRIVPSGISPTRVIPPARKLRKSLQGLADESELILLDCGAGLGREVRETIRVANELLLVTEPDLPSVMDSLKTKQVADGFGIPLRGAVLNRFNRHGWELTHRDVSEILEAPTVATIPEDRAVPESIKNRLPVVFHKPRSSSSRAFRRLAASLVGEELKESLWVKLWDRLH